MSKQITIGKLELGAAKASFASVMETNPLMMKFADKFKARLRGASPNDKAKFDEAIKEKQAKIVGGLSKFLLDKCKKKMEKAGDNEKKKIRIYDRFQKQRKEIDTSIPAIDSLKVAPKQGQINS